jgi:uncharacterized membrane protein
MGENMFDYDWPRLHAALNDLPTALLLTAVIADLVALVSRREWLRQVSFATLAVGAIGGVAAVVSGLQAEENIAHGEAVHRVMESHELLGLITLGVFGVLTVWRLVRERKMRVAERSVMLVCSLVGVGVLFATANLGGRLVFEHAAAIPTTVLEAELRERTGAHEHDGPEARGAVAADTAAPAPPGHVDPPGTPPHTHSDPPGTPPHRH